MQSFLAYFNQQQEQSALSFSPIIRIIVQMTEKQPTEEADFIEEQSKTIQQQQINIIDSNVTIFRRMLKVSLRASLMRLCLFIAVVVFQEEFITTNTSQDMADSWSIIFFVIACMMEFLSIINDTTLIKFLRKEEQSLDKVKEDLQNKREVTTQTKLGSYTIYLSICEIVDKYKYHSAASASISETVRFLHTFFTFYTFAHLAIYSQNSYPGQFFKVAFLWLFILSIYFTNFEIDLATLENSSGPYLNSREGQQELKYEQDKGQLSESMANCTIKQRYIRNCRWPFEIVYIISVVAILACILLNLNWSLLNVMLVICCCCLVAELLHEKYLQNKLIDLDIINQLNFKNLHCYRIMHELKKNSSHLFMGIRIATRTVTILTIMAYFRAQDLPLGQHLLFIVVNILLAFGQWIKFNRLTHCKLYVLTPEYKPDLREAECSICLLNCLPNQKVIQLPCFSEHVFHHNCMQKWFRERKECPLCRYSLEIYSLS